MIEAIITALLFSAIYITICFWVGGCAYFKTGKASSIAGWAAVSMMISPILGFIIMWCACDSATHMAMKEQEAKQKIEPAI